MQKNNFKILMFTLLAFAVILSALFFVAAAQSAVNLGTAGNFVILAKTGVSTTGTTSVVGNIGLSPAAASYVTGFDLIADSTNTFATSIYVQAPGKIYAADYTPPTPTVMTTAVSDMETAYTDAAGRTLPDYTERYAGDITGKTLTPGLYKWGTGVLISAGGVTLSGSSSDIFIFQIAQDLTVANGAIITLSGGAQAKNIFWQVAGQTTLGTTSQFKGIILCQTLIAMQTGAVLNGRALSQTAVTLNANSVSLPAGVAVVVIDTTPTATNVDTDTSSNSNSGSGSGSSSTKVQLNNSNGIGQQLISQIAEKRTEYKSGSFTTSLGQFLNVRELASGFRELREGNVVVKTKMNLIKVEGNKSKLEVELGNKSKVELKIMPSTASATALARLKLKVCSEANNCTIELKEVGVGKETKLAYQMKAQKDVKIIGLFKAKMNVEANVDAKTGEIINVKKPWWAGFAVEVQ